MYGCAVARPYWEDGKIPEDVNTSEEESAQFDCEAHGTPLPTISWLINGIPLAGHLNFLMFGH